jgi:hypothetical protein
LSGPSNAFASETDARRNNAALYSVRYDAVSIRQPSDLSDGPPSDIHLLTIALTEGGRPDIRAQNSRRRPHLISPPDLVCSASVVPISSRGLKRNCGDFSGDAYRSVITAAIAPNCGLPLQVSRTSVVQHRRRCGDGRLVS